MPGISAELKIREVASRKDLKKFIFLPEKIHAGHTTWVPPIYQEEWQYFNPKKNPALSYCERILLLAFRGEEVVGRVMGVVNPRHNDVAHELTARFALLETRQDSQVVRALLDVVENWAREKGMSKIVGPYGFSDQDPEGFLIEGFEHRATVATYHNYDWMPGLVEEQDYTKDIDYVTYRIDVPEEVPRTYAMMYDRIMKRGNYEVIEFSRKKDTRKWARPVFNLVNECYSGIYGFSPMDEREMSTLIERYLPVLDPRFLKLVTKDKEVVAFVVGIPDMTEGIQKAKGRLLPFGLFKILNASKKSKQLDLLLAAIKEEHRGVGLDMLLLTKMAFSAIEAGMKVVDTHHQMEANMNARLVLTEQLGGRIYKRFRVYGKVL